MERGNLGVDANEEATSGLNHERESTDAIPRDGAPRMSDEVRESGRSRGVRVAGPSKSVQPEMRSLKDKEKTVLHYANRIPGSLLHHEDVPR
jgi:hypothetical protein